MPFAGYENFDDCVAKNKDKDNPNAYCAEIKRKVEGDMTEDYPVKEHMRGGKKVKAHERGVGTVSTRDRPSSKIGKPKTQSEVKERLKELYPNQGTNVDKFISLHNITPENFPSLSVIMKMWKKMEKGEEKKGTQMTGGHKSSLVPSEPHKRAKMTNVPEWMKKKDMTNHDQNQTEVANMPEPEQDTTDITPGLYNIDGKLHEIDENGDVFELDFDINKSIKNNIEEKSDMETEDISGKEAYDAYWKETSQTKTDRSTAMMETRISKCMELLGKSWEECSKEVKSRMKKEGSENTNTEDVEEVEETEDSEEESADTVEVCAKEYDFLKEKYEELKAVQAEKDTMKEDFDKVIGLFNKIKEERDAELENKRKEKIAQLSKDFDIPEEELKDDSMEELLKTERRFDFALKKNSETEDVDDESDVYDETEDMIDEMKNRYYMKV